MPNTDETDGGTPETDADAVDADGDEKIGGLLAKLDAVAANVEGSTLKSPGKPSGE